MKQLRYNITTGDGLKHISSWINLSDITVGTLTELSKFFNLLNWNYQIEYREVI